MPIVLAGHSQGAAHVLRLLRDEIAGTPLEQRVAMVYAVGWPISIAFRRGQASSRFPPSASATFAGARAVMNWTGFEICARTHCAWLPKSSICRCWPTVAGV